MAGIDEKMTILAMDTATMVSSVAVATKERVLAELTAETRYTHSETLVVNIEEVMRLADVKREDRSQGFVSGWRRQKRFPMRCRFHWSGFRHWRSWRRHFLRRGLWLRR